MMEFKQYDDFIDVFMNGRYIGYIEPTPAKRRWQLYPANHLKIHHAGSFTTLEAAKLAMIMMVEA